MSLGVPIGLDERVPNPVSVDVLKQELAHLLGRGEITQRDYDLRVEYYEMYFNVGNKYQLWDIRCGKFPAHIIADIERRAVERDAALLRARQREERARLKQQRKSEPMLTRPVRAFRQWLHDLSAATRPLESVGTFKSCVSENTEKHQQQAQ